MYEHSPSDRMQLRSRGDLMHPGTCMICGSGNKERYLDLGIFIDYEGQMYLCADEDGSCLIQCAEIIGCLIPQEAAHIHKLAEDATNELAACKAELEKANERLAVYDSAIRSIATSSDGPSDSGPLVGSNVLAEVNEGPKDRESVPEESIKIARRNHTKQSELRNEDADRFRGGIEL